MGMLDLREQRHSKHEILQDQDLIIKNDYREKKKKNWILLNGFDWFAWAAAFQTWDTAEPGSDHKKEWL